VIGPQLRHGSLQWNALALGLAAAHWAGMGTLMEDHRDVIADQWYQEAFDELEAQGHLDPASRKVNGRRRTDGRLYLRSDAESS
jgi:hypothetical protein